MKHPKSVSQKHMGIIILGMVILFIAIYIVVWRMELKLIDGGHMVLEVGEELSHDVEDYLNLTTNEIASEAQKLTEENLKKYY